MLIVNLISFLWFHSVAIVISEFKQFHCVLQQSVSADALIENLLGKKDTFKPKNSQHGLVPGSAPGSQVTLPFY
jgi:hypothetical protein